MVARSEEKFGDYFRRTHPNMFRGGGCGGCRDVQMLLNNYGPEKLEENVDRLAGELARISGVELDTIIAAMRASATLFSEDK